MKKVTKTSEYTCYEIWLTEEDKKFFLEFTSRPHSFDHLNKHQIQCNLSKFKILDPVHNLNAEFI